MDADCGRFLPNRWHVTRMNRGAPRVMNGPRKSWTMKRRRRGGIVALENARCSDSSVAARVRVHNDATDTMNIRTMNSPF
jgi:hypothetical protein